MLNWTNGHSLGLRDADIDFIRSTFGNVKNISRVRIFGSRAKGNYTSGSDIDIAYEGHVSHREKSDIWNILTYEAPFLYKVDIIDYKNAPKELQDHIDRVGVTI